MEKENLVTFLKVNGIKKTLETLIDIAKETRPVVTEMEPNVNLLGKFEIDLFCMSYYLYYLTNKNSPQALELGEAVADFYSRIPEHILDPFEKRMFNKFISDKDAYIRDKIIQYQREIIENGQNENYLPKYIFSSFLMYPTMTVESIKRVSHNISDSNAVRFHVIISGLLDFLYNTCEKIGQYVA